MLLLSGLVQQTTVEYLAFKCVTVAKSRRLAKDMEGLLTAINRRELLPRMEARSSGQQVTESKGPRRIERQPEAGFHNQKLRCYVATASLCM